VRLFQIGAGLVPDDWLQIGLAELAAMPAVCGLGPNVRAYSGLGGTDTDLLLVPIFLRRFDDAPPLRSMARTKPPYVPAALAMAHPLQRVWMLSYCAGPPP